MNEISQIKKMVKNKKAMRIFWENHVYYKNWYYYKIPSIIWKLIFYSNLESFSVVNKNYELIKKYFWKDFEIAETQILKDENNHYVIKQKKVDWEILLWEDVKEDKIIKEKFRKLMKINEKLWKEEKIFLDLLWTDFISKPKNIHNIIKKWKDLYLFDFWVLKKNSKNPFFWFFSNLFYHLQRFVIYKFYL